MDGLRLQKTGGSGAPGFGRPGLFGSKGGGGGGPGAPVGGGPSVGSIPASSFGSDGSGFIGPAAAGVGLAPAQIGGGGGGMVANGFGGSVGLGHWKAGPPAPPPPPHPQLHPMPGDPARKAVPLHGHSHGVGCTTPKCAATATAHQPRMAPCRSPAPRAQGATR